MRPLVIVQADEVARMTAPLAQAAHDCGAVVIDVSLRHSRLLGDFAGYEPIFIYGSVALLHSWALQYPALLRWIWWERRALSPDVWADKLGAYYLNSDGFQTQAGLVEDGWYSRPMLNTKSFTGGLNASVTADPATLVWAAPPKHLNAEVRVFVVAGRPTAASVYQVDGGHSRQANGPLVDGAMAAGAAMLERYTPLPHCVLDLALVDDEWRVIEFNSINTSAWYAADPGVVLRAYLAAHHS